MFKPWPDEVYVMQEADGDDSYFCLYESMEEAVGSVPVGQQVEVARYRFKDGMFAYAVVQKRVKVI